MRRKHGHGPVRPVWAVKPLIASMASLTFIYGPATHVTCKIGHRRRPKPIGMTISSDELSGWQALNRLRRLPVFARDLNEAVARSLRAFMPR
jgi:hypothetical protein